MGMRICLVQGNVYGMRVCCMYGYEGMYRYEGMYTE